MNTLIHVSVIILLVGCLVGMGVSLFLLSRNDKVAAMLREANELCYQWNMANIEALTYDRVESAYDWAYKKLPSYERILWSTKPLKLKYWLRPSILKQLNSGTPSPAQN